MSGSSENNVKMVDIPFLDNEFGGLASEESSQSCLHAIE